MGVLHESRLDNAVHFGGIGIGERVEVKTMMGVPVATGEVVATSPFGIVLGGAGYYDGNLYLFSPVTEEPEVRVANELSDANLSSLSPDDRVARKLRDMGESRLVYEVAKSDEPEEKKPDEKAVPVDSGVTKKDSGVPTAVDVETLPDDIKKAIVSSSQLDAENLNSVMAEIGDSVVKALKRVNVKDMEVYSSAAEIQAAVFKVLTGKDPKPKGK